MKKKIIFISLTFLFGILLLAAQITDVRNVQFTAKAANCGSYDLPLSREEYAVLKKFDVSFDAQFSKRFFGKAKMDGTVAYNGETYEIFECLPVNQGYMLEIRNQENLKERCTYLTMDSEFTHFYLMDGPHCFGPADTYEALIESLDVFEKPY